MFEGFDCDESPKNGEYLRADIPKILNNEDIHTHYNLHGSANWDVEALVSFPQLRPYKLRVKTLPRTTW
ncbi:hypothetical protein D6B99_16165 [Arachidicoccus soli]|uniref:Uncharacterized protein n=1 Tax=Arachidicoccus soli TaxID=2341117 RepID=A0A386HTK6_9BACT|nr:hypothetical protein D6B99_16165 [Arachidicoccus soli]